MATQELVFNFLRTFWNFPKLTSRTCELCKTHWTSVEHKRTISTLLHAKYLRSREACGGTSTRSFFLNSKRDAHKIDKREQFKEVKAQLVSLELSLKEDDSDVGKKALADKEKFMQEAVDEVNALKIYDILPHDPPDPSVLTKRPPVVTIMGHVDHGKTTLLDYLRKTSTVHKEFGGITQHIGAFSVKLPSGERITFLDTPGHAAFRVMRQRGANVTDIVILVVAADDGVKDQTVESIKYAKEAGVPIIVAINKTDKHTADIERTMQMLAQHDILVEELGGEIQAVPISALKGSNILALEEAIIALAEVMDIKADPIGKVEGHIIESRTDLGRGKLATILVTRGTLKKGDLVIAGTGHGRVRTMFDDLGKMITKARPGTAVEVIGWKELPSAGDFLLQAKSEKEIKDALLYRNRAKRLDKSLEMVQSTIEAHAKQKMFSKEKHKIKVENVQLNLHRISYSYDDPTKEAFDGPEYNILVKGDVNGSVEAILHMIDTYDSKLCQLNVVHYGVGPVTEADLELARTFNGEIFAFNLKTTASIARYAKALDVSIHNFNVIYRMFDAIKNNINKKLPIGTKEVSFGEAVVQKIFQMKDGKRRVAVAGCVCIKGTLKKQHRVKVVRNGQTILTSTVMSMKHHKKNLDEIRQDMECGICLTDNSIPLQENDQLVFFELEEHQATVRWDPGF